MGVYLLLWGGWLASPWWSTYASTPSWRVVALLVPAWVMGSFPIASAFLLILAHHKRWHKLRHTVLLFLVGYFQFSALLFLIANPWAVGWITYTMVAALFAFLLFSNLKYE